MARVFSTEDIKLMTAFSAIVQGTPNVPGDMFAKLVVAHLWSTNLLFAYSGGRVLDHADPLRFQALRRHIGYIDADNATNMRIQDTLCFIVNACSSRKAEDESSVGHVAATGTLDAFSYGSGVVGEDARNKFTASYLYDVGYKKVYAFPTPTIPLNMRFSSKIAANWLAAVRKHEPITEFINFKKNESDFNSRTQRTQLFESGDGKQVMNLEEKNGGGTDNKDGVSIITMGEMICYLLKALGAWFDDEGKLALHPTDAEVMLRRTKEIASSSGPGIAMCIDMLDNWQHDLASNMTSESELPFREHVKESLKKSADCWQWTRSEKLPWQKQKRKFTQHDEYKGRGQEVNLDEKICYDFALGNTPCSRSKDGGTCKFRHKFKDDEEKKYWMKRREDGPKSKGGGKGPKGSAGNPMPISELLSRKP